MSTNKQHQKIKSLIESIVGNVLLTEADEMDLGALDDAGGDVGGGPDETSESDLGADLPAGDELGGELDFGGGDDDGASNGEGDGEDGEGGDGDLEGDLGDDAGGDIGGGGFGGGGFGGGGGSMGLDSGGDGDSSEGEEEDSTGVDSQVIDMSDADPVKSTTDMAISMLDETGDDQKILNAVKASIQGNFESFDEGLPIIKSLWDTNHPVLKIVARKLLFFIKGE